MFSRLTHSLTPHHEPCFTVELDQHSVRSASSVISGRVKLPVDEHGGAGGSGRKAFEEVHVKLRAVQHSTYQLFRPQPGPMGLSRNDYRSETINLIEDGSVLWSAPSIPSSSEGASSTQTSTNGKRVLEIPFAFTLPSLEEQAQSGFLLPPSFEGGTRSQSGEIGKGRVQGKEVGRNVYFIKVVGVRPTKLAQNERTVLPFIYLPPATLPSISLIPPPIVPTRDPALDSVLSIHPPPCPSEQDGWITVEASKSYRESLFGKDGIVSVSLTTPLPRPSYPTSHPIPFHLHLTTFSPPLPSSSSAPNLRLPSPSQVILTLDRTVRTIAQGARQDVLQTVKPVVDLAAEKRVWFEETVWEEALEPGPGRGGKGFAREGRRGSMEEAKVVGRWKRGLVVVGEMRFEGEGVGPCFQRGEEGQGRLGCEYSLSIHVPIKGVSSDLDQDNFLPIVLSSRVNLDLGEGGVAVEDFEFLPSYFDVSADAGGKGDIFDDDKKTG